MATSINQVLAVNIQDIDSATAAADRTFTTTRQLRIFDFKGYKTTLAVVGVACALTLSNAGGVCATMTTPNPPVVNTVYRLGQEIAASTLDDANMVVPAASTLIFAVATLDNFDLTAFCYPE